MKSLEHEQARYYLHIGNEDLTEAEQELLKRHLSECGTCRSYAGEADQVRSALSSVMHAQWDPITPPSRARDRIQNRIQRRIAQKRILSLANSLAAGVAVLGIIIVFAWFFRPVPVSVNPGSAGVPTRVNQTFGNTITLLGFALSGDQIAAGDTITTTLYWQARVTTQTSYMVFAHIQDANGRLVAQRDSFPVEGTRPTTGWRVDEVIEDAQLLRLPGSLSPGRYSLIVGVYDPNTGIRLNTGEGKDGLTLAAVTVKSPPTAKTYTTLLTGKAINLSTLEVSQLQGQAQIVFRLNEQGTKTFSDYTSEHIGQYVAITLDKKVLTCPKLLSPVRTGAFAIQGRFTLQQAQQMLDEIKKDPERLEIVEAGDAPLPLGESIQTGVTR